MGGTRVPVVGPSSGILKCAKRAKIVQNFTPPLQNLAQNFCKLVPNGICARFAREKVKLQWKNSEKH